MNQPRVLMAWSGGKDSVLALDALRTSGVPVLGLLTTVTESTATVSSHGVPLDLVRRQADALGLPLVEVALPEAADNATYRAAMRGALRQASDAHGVTDVAFGDLRLRDVRAWREAQVAEAGLRARFPLWGTASAELVRRVWSADVAATVARVDRTLVAGTLAGRAYDAGLVADLPAGADPAGEGGEFHTFVHRGPGFSWSVEACVRGCVEDERFTTAVLTATGY